MFLIPETHHRSSHLCREMPRILTIYDIDMPLDKVKASVRKLFYDNESIKDIRVQEALVMRLLEGYTVPNEADRKRLTEDATIDEQFARN
jgi:hypothetical protein